MAYEHKPGTFTLFRNDKGDNEKRPDYRGEGLDMAGNAIELACWLKGGGEGKAKFLSCTMKRKEAQETKKPSSSFADLKDDLPFSPLRKVESSLL